jgi:hypothetical protein
MDSRTMLRHMTGPVQCFHVVIFPNIITALIYHSDRQYHRTWQVVL